MTYAHGYNKPGAYDRQIPSEDGDLEYERALDKFCDEAESGGDEWMEKLDPEEITAAFRLIWKAWATKKTCAIQAGVIFDFETFDVLSQQFDGLLKSAIDRFVSTYEGDQ